MGLSSKIILGLVCGVLIGLFLGERAAPIGVAGDIFIGLMQMTILPYILVSLIANIGRLSIAESLRLLRVGGGLLLIFLAMGIVALVVIPLSFPELSSGSFFSRSTVEPNVQNGIVEEYLPANPFVSLSQGTVPAIVVFGLFIGVGLIPVARKAEIIRLLDTATDALVHVNKLIIKLTPLGVFAIAAAAAGTKTIEEIARLQTYLLSYSAAVFILTFVILPLMVWAATPFRIRDIFRNFGSTMLLIFVTGKIIVAMPQIIESIERTFRGYLKDSDAGLQDAEVLVPIIYPFPNLGTFVIFAFVPFVAWFVGTPLDAAGYPMFLGATLVVSFASPLVGIPYLLDLLRLPSDMFQLFVISSVYTDRIRVVLGGMHIFALTVLAGAALHGLFRLRWKRVAVFAAVSIGLAVVSIIGVRYTLSGTLKHTPPASSVIAKMQLLEPARSPARVAQPGPNPLPVDEEESLLERIRRRGILRFGYEDHPPFCFQNAAGEIVGLDVELMYRFAATLGVKLELVPVARQNLVQQARDDYFDIAGCAFKMTAARSAAHNLSVPYLDLHGAFIVEDYRRHDFKSRSRIAALGLLNVGVASDDEFAGVINDWIPGINAIRLDSVEEYLSGDRPDLDALFTSAEAGAVLTMLNPRYKAVSPSGDIVSLPVAFVVSQSDPKLSQILDNWILLRQKHRLIDRLYEHWILGKSPQQREPRWSVARDVLGWLP